MNKRIIDKSIALFRDESLNNLRLKLGDSYSKDTDYSIIYAGFLAGIIDSWHKDFLYNTLNCEVRKYIKDNTAQV